MNGDCVGELCLFGTFTVMIQYWSFLHVLPRQAVPLSPFQPTWVNNDWRRTLS